MDTRVGNGLETPIQGQYNNADSAHSSVLWPVFKCNFNNNSQELYSHKHDILCRFSYSLATYLVQTLDSSYTRGKEGTQANPLNEDFSTVHVLKQHLTSILEL